MKKVILFAAIASFLVASQASAVSLPASLDIDFRDRVWAPADGTHSYTVGDVTATAYPESAWAWLDAKLTQSSVNGLGVDTKYDFGEDEINITEKLVIDFVKAICVREIWLTKLFDVQGDHDDGSVKIFNGASLVDTIYFSGTPDGNLQLEVGEMATSLVFATPRSLCEIGDDYNVVGINRCNVPDTGSSFVLLGLGVLGLVAIRRRFSK